MVWALILIYAPIGLFVAAFVYETLLSFRRLKDAKRGRAGYVDATWEVTHTLLIFGVVMLFMLFTKAIDELASVLFVSILLAGAALTVRAIFYLYIFYVRSPKAPISVVDRLFAYSNVVAAGLLVIVVVQATWYLWSAQPSLNQNFIGPFLFGLVPVIAICLVPLLQLYRTK